MERVIFNLTHRKKKKSCYTKVFEQLFGSSNIYVKRLVVIFLTISFSCIRRLRLIW